MKDISIHVAGGECYFSLNLRRLRLSRQPRLSQERLAQKLGVSRATYAKYEQGRRMPPAWFVFSTANYFGVAAEDIFASRLKLAGTSMEDKTMENKDTKFKVGDRIEATWAGGHTSKHIITGIDVNAPRGIWYQFLDEDGRKTGLYEEFLSACHTAKEGKN